MKSTFVVLFALSLAALSHGCKGSQASGEKLAVASGPQASSAAPTPADKAKTSRLVFIDKQEACDCTRARVTKGWDALQAALAGKTTPGVEHLYVDTQPDEVRPYRELRPMMAVPALYFLDASGALVELLQGEFTTQQIQEVLGKAP